MIFLLDVSVLVPLMWPSHEHYKRVQSWVVTQQPSLQVASCPLSELGFMRISMQVMKCDFSTALNLLKAFRQFPKYHFWHDDFSPIGLSDIQGYKQLSDFYLAELARRNKGKLATLDGGIKHPSVAAIP